MTISVVQKNARTTATGTSGVCPAWSTSPVAGNLLLIIINELGAFTGTWSTTPTGYTAVSPTPFIYYTTPLDPYGIYWKIATGGDATPANIGADGGSAGPWIIYTYEFANSGGGWNSSPVDVEVHSAASSTAVTTKASGTTATLAQATELGIAVLATSVAITAPAVGGGFGISNPTTGADSRLQVALQSTAFTTPLATTWTWTTSARAGARIVTFKTGAGGTVFSQSVAGALSFAGSAPKKASQRRLPGGVSFSGARSSSPTARLTQGSFTPTGAVTKKLTLQRTLVAAVLRPTGAVSRAAAHAVSGALTFTGTRTSIKSVSKAVSGALTFSGAQTRLPAKVMTGLFTPTGLLSRIAARGQILTATLTPQTRSEIGAIVPAYNYPNPTLTWDGWIAGAPFVKMMIANPGSPGGPGTFTDSNYVTAIAHAQAAGIRILGYVDTSYAAIPQATVTGQIDSWFTLYGIRDIFFDQTSSSAVDLAYYQTICDYAHTHGAAKVVINPGTNPVEGYFNGMADIVIPFEGSQTDYDAYTPPSFITSYPRSMVAHLVYDVPNATQMLQDVTKATRTGAGYTYITNDTLAGFPWDTLPGYWTTEYAMVLTGFTKRTNRLLGAIQRPVAAFASASRGIMTGVFRPTAGAVTHSLPSRMFSAGLQVTGSVAKFTARRLFSALVAGGVMNTRYIPPAPQSPPGGGGFGALMSNEFFQRYDVAEKWRHMKRVRVKL